MRVLFLEIDTDSSWCVASLGPAFIAAVLRDAGHQVEFHRVSIEASPEDTLKAVQRTQPGLIGFSLTSRQWLRGREVAQQLKQRLKVPIVAGGLHPTYSPEQVISDPAFDYVCLGEGELACLELVECLDRGDKPGSIANIWTEGSGRPELRPVFEPLDEMPFLARDCLDENHGVRHICTQRGCPFPCSYCAARQYSDLYEGVSSYGRRRSVTNVLEELRELRDKHSLNYIIFLDDTFTINHPWIYAFCDLYKQEFSQPFSIHARVETMSPRLLKALAEAGCRHITYGVESGNERIRREILKRPVTNDRFKEVFQASKDLGIIVTANFMLGIPEETPSDIEDTLSLCEELPLDDFGHFVFYPFRGTELFQYCLDKGYLPEDMQDRPAVHRQSILNLPTLSQKDIEDYYDRFVELRVALIQERHRQHSVGGDIESQLETIRKDVIHCAKNG